MKQEILAAIFTTCSLNFPSDFPKPENWVEADGLWWNQAIDTTTSKMTVEAAGSALIPSDVLAVNPDLTSYFGFIYRSTDKTVSNEHLACKTIKEISSKCEGASILATMAGMVAVEELECE